MIYGCINCSFQLSKVEFTLNIQEKKKNRIISEQRKKGILLSISMLRPQQLIINLPPKASRLKHFAYVKCSLGRLLWSWKLTFGDKNFSFLKCLLPFIHHFVSICHDLTLWHYFGHLKIRAIVIEVPFPPEEKINKNFLK